MKTLDSSFLRAACIQPVAPHQLPSAPSTAPKIAKYISTFPSSTRCHTGWALPETLHRPMSSLHEVGHHVQNLLGIASKVNRLQRQGTESEGNALSVRMELQADCFAGVWGYHAKRERNLIEPGDFEEGLRAASAIGDDQLQKMSRGYTRPESWTAWIIGATHDLAS